MDVPAVLMRYVAGLAAHDVAAVGATVGDDLAFVAVARTMERTQFLAFLTALYSGFPDWSYDHDAPQPAGDGSIRIRWRQGGTHAQTLALPGFPAVAATFRRVTIPEQDFHYVVADGLIRQIRPDPIEGGAPRGIFQQIGVALPPL